MPENNADQCGSNAIHEKKRKRDVEINDALDGTTSARGRDGPAVALEKTTARSDSLSAVNEMTRPAGDSIHATKPATCTWVCAVEATKSISSMSIATIAVTKAVVLRTTSPQNIAALRAASPSVFGLEDDEWMIGNGVYFF